MHPIQEHTESQVERPDLGQAPTLRKPYQSPSFKRIDTGTTATALTGGVETPDEGLGGS